MECRGASSRGKGRGNTCRPNNCLRALRGHCSQARNDCSSALNVSVTATTSSTTQTISITSTSTITASSTTTTTSYSSAPPAKGRGRLSRRRGGYANVGNRGSGEPSRHSARLAERDDVPDSYTKACPNFAAFSSACSCIGITPSTIATASTPVVTEITTATIPATATTTVIETTTTSTQYPDSFKIVAVGSDKAGYYLSYNGALYFTTSNGDGRVFSIDQLQRLNFDEPTQESPGITEAFVMYQFTDPSVDTYALNAGNMADLEQQPAGQIEYPRCQFVSEQVQCSDESPDRGVLQLCGETLRLAPQLYPDCSAIAFGWQALT